MLNYSSNLKAFTRVLGEESRKQTDNDPLWCQKVAEMYPKLNMVR